MHVTHELIRKGFLTARTSLKSGMAATADGRYPWAMLAFNPSSNASVVACSMFLFPTLLAVAATPSEDPAASYKLSWTANLAWPKAIDITTAEGADADAKLASAQAKLAAQGGGVVFFPAGTYHFKQSIKLKDGVVLRGVPPVGETDARKDGYRLGSVLEFPKYEFKASGDGTPIDTAFKSIEPEDPATGSNTGVVDLDINRGHILLKQADDGACGKNRLIVGCILRNTAFADPGIPDAKIGQKPWQRHTWRFGAAIEAKSAENLLIANNRLPKSGDDDFKMSGFVVLDQKKQPFEIDGVPFDYDNRVGIYANHESLGGQGGSGPDGTPESHPLGFRKGVVIRGNYIYGTGRCAIGFSGDGTVCSDNVLRFAKDVWRPTATGRDLTNGSSTNDNRAMEIRGWRWTVSNNDYEVYRNWAFDRKYYINDGEGLMHEDHANSTVKDSILSGNKGNAYLSIYKTAGIDGLRVEGNDIRLADNAGTLPAIFVASNRTNDTFPTRNVKIINNTVGGQGILIDGSKDSADNLIKGNKTAGPCYAKGGEYIITNQANAKVEDNQGFAKVDDSPWLSQNERKAAGKKKK
jgi:hypothetical protein